MKTIEQMHDEKQKNIAKYVDRKEINIQTLACMHDAIALTCATMEKNGTILDKEAIFAMVEEYLNGLYEIAGKKIEKESTPNEDIENSMENPLEVDFPEK